MVFTRIEFFLFFGLVLAGIALTRRNRSRKWLLLAASYYFYACWDWRFLALIMGVTLAGYWVGLGLDQNRITPRGRSAILIAGLVFHLGILGFFKYCNFFCESLQAVLRPFGWSLGTLQVMLPIGVSFYVLQIVSYMVDVHSKRVSACRTFIDFALFVAFFPKLVAGPIVRAADFLPQLATHVRISRHDVFLGFRQFTIGLFKKVFIADRLAVLVDYVFGNAGAFDTNSTWLAVLAYGVQVYCDFSGYSDMAIGTARIIGYQLPENFRSPYLATSITDFWHRWHISLSTWLRDYLYIPLGGNRRGKRRMYINLLVTMALGGLWHGASWTFLCWGVIHGGALAGEKWVCGKWRIARDSSILSQVLGWFVTMLVVFTAWVFFRAASFAQAFQMLRQMYIHSDGLVWYPPFAIFGLIGVALLHVLMAIGRFRVDQLVPGRIVTPVVLFSMWWLVLAFPPKAFSPFVYAQF